MHQQASSELTKQHKHPADLDDVVLTYLLAICTKETFDNLENRWGKNERDQHRFSTIDLNECLPVQRTWAGT